MSTFRTKAAAPNLAWAGVGLAGGFWLLESLLHAFVFGDAPLLASLSGGDDTNELWMRLIICLLFVGFGWIAERAVRSERRLRDDAQRLSRLVRFADDVKESLPQVPEVHGPPAPPPKDLADAADDIGKLARLLWDLSEFMETRFKELYVLLQLTHEIGTGLLLEEVLDKAYGTLRTVLPYDRLSVALLEDDGRTVRARWARTECPRMILGTGYAAPLQGSSLQAIIASGAPRIINDLVAYRQAHPGSDSTRLMVEEGIRSSLTCPLIVAGKPIGFMFFSSRSAGVYEHVHVEVFKLIAGHLSLVVEKSSLYQQVLHEKENSESLLLNVIPERVAARLRAGEHPIAEFLPAVGIVFVDLEEFTTFASRASAEQVLNLLQDVFLYLDHLCDLYEVEKIKTIGDEYMAISEPSGPDHGGLRRLADFAIDALASIGRMRYPDGQPVKVRIGMHAGPAVAGVIGQKKFAYDIWGDAVNTASRMESYSESGRIQVSAEVYQQLREAYLFEERGTIDVKGKGPMTTYFLLERKDGARGP